MTEEFRKERAMTMRAIAERPIHLPRSVCSNWRPSTPARKGHSPRSRLFPQN
jgi:hypothetical protein